MSHGGCSIFLVYDVFFLKVIAKSTALLWKMIPAFMHYVYFLLGEPNHLESKIHQVVWVVFLVLKFEVKSEDRKRPGNSALHSANSMGRAKPSVRYYPKHLKQFSSGGRWD